MTNKEKYAKEIADLAINEISIAINKTTNKPCSCYEIKCCNCLRGQEEWKCLNKKKLQEWANSEYVETPILTDEEKDYLSAFIKPFRDKANYIRKDRFSLSITFQIDNDMSRGYVEMPLRLFDKNMFNGMELDKEYTIDDLGL